MKRFLMITATVAALAVDGSRSLSTAQPRTGQLFLAPPRLETLAATRTLVAPAPSWRVDIREPNTRFQVHDQPWPWLFPHTAVPAFSVDALGRRHWWADPLLRRHWWD